MDKHTLTHELAIKYTFENFDFKNDSPENLLNLYQETHDKIYSVLKDQEKKFIEESMEKASYYGVLSF
ncbi:hypothetical protein [Paraclostridium sordellii]|uniref:Uncharacterized protein n=1 Tax=Paraclostridium sordellii TaxID=1505 RepID=A0A0C7E7T5_PARSO|nr:hypothetical protein [Paeniclostridium sordellii]QYE99776.1 hypothetical protein KZ987_18145 [Paeniclostridium sordellii]CEN21130.1 Uncharacterised protein [[Clostridium] sordellii] [Paeniclostridium sordellii]CEN21961.1 Uncharacterised protein [[Clostridium] sordellii] [Paeniclostridium sordellii]CEP40415.1 Uncharacterised protein [[Clostridium] sordellii] [Paeniclostridium sordellii]CEP41130.1 Uncharacterised protein [[Clostridium] sordellii] [Paeniclostridium sordellii]